MKPVLRLEEPKDYYEVENLTREAFWEFPGRAPGCDEHFLVHKLRTIPGFIKELDYVAVLDEKIIGNIMYSKSKVIDTRNREYETITFGPVSVLPAYQRQGVGTSLIEFTLNKAKELSYRGVIIFGHPEYYPRFGFKNAKEFKITTEDGSNLDPFMAYELYKGALDGITGRFYGDPVFKVNADEAKEFDKKFPLKI